ncbi:hypothetical protein NBO_64g0045 [Nosema bombycis CQ1]|uniref:Uncharacterized protein n=1 Tax=Nosema bombycis (strain CQ1 / CVCC 102059) TaxID=578461 RepID=R0M6N1_NOSB1|nr:hypothetical protein NBO_64g0045 [Nosema bombycis CQ1]|eukprot:EOB13664.1 hypothetical protein NBO_64g0045 [Nosema bombycis CQ1]
MLLFYLNLFQTKKKEVLFFKNSSKNIEEKAPYDVEDSLETSLDDNKPTPDKLFGLEMKVKNINLAFDCENSHKFCRYFNKETVSKEENIVLTGVVGILIRKYDKIPNYTLGLLIIRIINLLGDKFDFTLQQISTIHNIYFNIRLVGVNMKKTGTGNERQVLTFQDCLNENLERSKKIIDQSSSSEENEQSSNFNPK